MFHAFISSALDGGVSFTTRALYLRGKGPQYSLDRRLAGALEPVWTRWRREKKIPLFFLPGIETRSSIP